MVLAAILAPASLTLYGENTVQSSGWFVKPGSQGNVILHGFIYMPIALQKSSPS